MKALDAGWELIRHRLLPVSDYFAGGLCSALCSCDEAAAALMEALWSEADFWLKLWRQDSADIRLLKRCGRLWLMERTVKCRWKAAKQIARQLLDETEAAARMAAKRGAERLEAQDE